MIFRSKLGALVGIFSAGLFRSARAREVGGHSGLAGRWDGWAEASKT
jgi:hypothetical protein